MSTMRCIARILIVIGFQHIVFNGQQQWAMAHPNFYRDEYLSINTTDSQRPRNNLKAASQVFFHLRSEPTTNILGIEQPSRLARLTPEAYFSIRNQFSMIEENRALGSDIKLTNREMLANDIVMEEKVKEYDVGLATPHLFKPSQHIFSVLDEIRNSPVFKYLSQMPKGAVLHAHDTALCSTDAIIKFTYYDHLWVCRALGDFEPIELKFSKTKPTHSTKVPCSWELLSAVRASLGNFEVDERLRERLTLYPTEKFLDNNVAWQQFLSIFGLVNGLLMYRDVWADYYYKALEEFSADGVQYLEFRTTLPVLYDLNGTDYQPIDTVRVYKETLDRFMGNHPDFIGSRMIYAPSRNTNADGINYYIKNLLEIKAKYPDFLAGFDLVGQEELGRPLKDFIPQLLTLPEDIKFYFHAGETNWYGSTTDENLIDAILLGTQRIGHGFALIKHPLAMNMVKAANIAIEVNPVSNQVLQLVSDYRNHPCSHLFADNYPIVISSDDPSFWKATPLTHDFYMAFMGIASAHADLRLLKKLAINSLEYSSLDDERKAKAYELWQNQWDKFIESLIAGGPNSATQHGPNNRLD